jgi:UDPglucose 6-dehydrogenase
MKKIAIIGYGWVGKAMEKLFPDALIYIRSVSKFSGKEIGKGNYTGQKDRINECDIAFVCVPTPCLDEGQLDMVAVEEVVAWCTCPLLVMRSTVNPGTCGILSKKYNKRIVMQPEYLGETPNHPMLDPRTRQFLIIGGDSKDRRELIELYTTVYNANTAIREVTAYEAEIIKVSENRAIAFKVAECQELYDACEKAGVNYYTIRDAVYSDDPRFNLWFTMIYPGKRGMNSKCMPKDIYAWKAWAESLGYTPKITKALLEKNKEWIQENSQ